jgi:hypothetical protein
VTARADTLLYLDDELPGAQAWAERRHAPLTWVPEILELRATLMQPETRELFYLRGRFDEYRELPPMWTFTDKEWTAAPVLALFPKVSSTPYGSPLFITSTHGPVICAPFNRLAYAAHGGPHADWTLAAWLTAGATGQVRADSVGDMLSIIYRDFMLVRGRMG